MSNVQATEVMLVGRVVNGHPMTRRGVTKRDPTTRQDVPVLDTTSGLQVTEAYLAVAIPKAGEADWKQTSWGQPMFARAAQDWPNGEHGALDFSWKVVDGDSQIPNKKGNKPADREGYPGHWVVHCTTRFNVRSFHVGKYDPTQQIQEENAIKCGDYCRLLVGVKGNGPTESPGIYVNPMLFELARAGTPIISDGGPSAADAFGGGATQQPAVQQPAVQQPAVQQPAVQPAPDLLQPQAAPEVKYLDANGNAFTEAQLVTAGYTPAQIAGLVRA
jgi:hypothetical protein